MAGEGKQLIITTPFELRQAVKAVTGRQSRTPAGGSGKRSAAGKKSVTASAQADSSASEEEEVLGPVPHMQQLVTKLVEASQKPQFLDAAGQPRYVLLIRIDDGKAGEASSIARLSGGEFRSFKPANLSSEHLGQDEALKPGLLFFGCTQCAVPIDAMKGKYAIGPESGRRTNKEGRPQLKSFSALIGAHDSRKHAATASSAAKLRKTAAGFTLSAAAAQSTPFSFNLGPGKAAAAAAADGLTAPEGRGENIALRLPFSQPPFNSRDYALESVLSVDELQAVATDKATICTSAYRMTCCGALSSP